MNAIDATLSAEDQMRFDSNMSNVDLAAYFLVFSWGLHTFVMKDETLPLDTKRILSKGESLMLKANL